MMSAAPSSMLTDCDVTYFTFSIFFGGSNQVVAAHGSSGIYECSLISSDYDVWGPLLVGGFLLTIFLFLLHEIDTVFKSVYISS